MISMRTFYLAGAILFLAQTIGNIWSITVLWDSINTGAKISSVAGILFSAILCNLFIFLYRAENVFKSPDLKEEDLLNIIGKAKK